MRGSDQMYGDNGVNMNLVARSSIPWVNGSVRATSNHFTAGRDLLYGDSDASAGNSPSRV